jgi:hypothetical protein
VTPDETRARLQALIDTFVQEERAAVLRYLQHLPEVCAACCDAAVSDAIDAIEDGLHRRGGDS